MVIVVVMVNFVCVGLWWCDVSWCVVVLYSLFGVFVVMLGVCMFLCFFVCYLELCLGIFFLLLILLCYWLVGVYVKINDW